MIKLETRTHVGSMEVRYDRINEQMYGTRGIGPRHVRAQPVFWRALEAWAAHLAEVCPAGAPEVLASGGFQVDKGSSTNAHRLGLAFDLDGLFWAEDREPPFITLQAPADIRRYLAVEAGLRLFFGVVLNHFYNRAHEDHFHVSAHSAPGWRRGSPQRVLFVQLVLTHLFGLPVTIDGKYGPQTAGAARAALAELAGPDNLADGWEEFCLAAELVGWEKVEAG